MRPLLVWLLAVLLTTASLSAADKFKPLKEVLRDLRKDYPGRVLDTRLRNDDYEIRILTRSGEVVELLVDGATGEVEEVKEGKGGQ